MCLDGECKDECVYTWWCVVFNWGGVVIINQWTDIIVKKYCWNSDQQDWMVHCYIIYNVWILPNITNTILRARFCQRTPAVHINKLKMYIMNWYDMNHVHQEYTNPNSRCSVKGGVGEVSRFVGRNGGAVSIWLQFPLGHMSKRPETN